MSEQYNLIYQSERGSYIGVGGARVMHTPSFLERLTKNPAMRFTNLGLFHSFKKPDEIVHATVLSDSFKESENGVAIVSLEEFLEDPKDRCLYLVGQDDGFLIHAPAIEDSGSIEHKIRTYIGISSIILQELTSKKKSHSTQLKQIFDIFGTIVKDEAEMVNMIQGKRFN